MGNYLLPFSLGLFYASAGFLADGCLNESLKHSLNRYPDFIVVQVRTREGIFQGQG